LFLLLQPDVRPWRNGRSLRRWLVALLPLVVIALYAACMTVAGIRSAAGQGGGGQLRGWRELSLYSPAVRGLFTWRAFGTDSAVYLGWVLPVLLLAGVGAQAFRFAPQTGGAVAAHPGP